MSALTDFFKRFEPRMLSAIAHALSITTAIKDFLYSPEGKMIEGVIADIIPQGETWTGEVTIAVNAITAGLTELKDPRQWRGILWSLGGEIYAIIHGRRKTMDQYLKEFQDTFVG